MVTPADVKKLADRWKRATRALRIQEQAYGHRLVRMLEDSGDRKFAVIDDPLEAAAFILFIGMVKELERERSGREDLPVTQSGGREDGENRRSVFR
jgi:hypothetical protein